MKIYFAGSIRGGREDKEKYSKIIGLLKNYGEVLTEHVGDPKISELGQVELGDERIYKMDMDWLRESDVFIAEISVHSAGVGYEIAYAEIWKKKILCLYCEGSEKRISGMINGNKNLPVKVYKNIEDLPAIFDEFLK